MTGGEIALDTIYIFADGRIDARVRPHQLQVNGRLQFSDVELSPEQIAIRDAFISMIEELVVSKIESNVEAK